MTEKHSKYPGTIYDTPDHLVYFMLFEDLQRKLLHKKCSVSLMIPQETPSLLFFTKEIFHRKHHLTCSENIYRFLKILYLEIFEKLRSVKTN